MKELTQEDKLRLMRFVCSFAWADLEVRAAERALVQNFMNSLELTPESSEKVKKWMQAPPLPEEIDPQDIPMAHREMFLEAARAMIVIDGHISQQEADHLELFAQLLGVEEE